MAFDYSNYTMVRDGLKEHIELGRMTPADLGVYVMMHMERNWETGIYIGSSDKLAFSFGGTGYKKDIQKSLNRLRDNGFINYKEGTGRRGNYPILLHKCDITRGKMRGMRLNAFAEGSLTSPVYEKSVPEEPKYATRVGADEGLTRGWEESSPQIDDQNHSEVGADEGLTSGGSSTDVRPTQYIKYTKGKGESYSSISPVLSEPENDTGSSPEPPESAVAEDVELTPTDEVIIPVHYSRSGRKNVYVDKLVKMFLNYQKNRSFNKSEVLKGWHAQLTRLLDEFGDSLGKYMKYAFEIDVFWSDGKLIRREPLSALDYFEKHLPGIITNYERWQKVRGAKKRKESEEASTASEAARTSLRTFSDLQATMQGGGAAKEGALEYIREHAEEYKNQHPEWYQHWKEFEIV